MRSASSSVPALDRWRYLFDSFELDGPTGQLHLSGERVGIQPRPLRALYVLVRAMGRVVSTHELLDSAWSDVHVSRGAVKYAIHAARRALDRADGGGQRIVSVAAAGYRFDSRVTRCSVASKGAAALAGVMAESDTQRVVWRGSELAELTRACRDGCSLVVVEGASRSGKSHLLLRLAEKLQAAGMTTHMGGGGLGGISSAEAWLDILRSGAAVAPRSLARHMSAALRALRRQLGAIESAPEAEADDLRRELQRQLGWLIDDWIDEAARSARLALIVDDLALGDAVGASVVEHVVRPWSSASVTVIVALRRVPMPGGAAGAAPLWRALGRPSTALMRLDRVGSERIHAALASFSAPGTRVEWPDPLADALDRASGGDVGVLSALTWWVLGDPSCAAKLPGRIDPGASSPATRVAVLARLAAVSPECREIVAAIARSPDAHVTAGDTWSSSALAEAIDARLVEARGDRLSLALPALSGMLVTPAACDSDAWQ